MDTNTCHPERYALLGLLTCQLTVMVRGMGVVVRGEMVQSPVLPPRAESLSLSFLQ